MESFLRCLAHHLTVCLVFSVSTWLWLCRVSCSCARSLQLQWPWPLSICSMQDPHCNGFACWEHRLEDTQQAEHRLEDTQASALVVHGLSSCGSEAPELGLRSCGAQAQLPCSIWDPPGQGIKSVPCIARQTQLLDHQGSPISLSFTLDFHMISQQRCSIKTE